MRHQDLHEEFDKLIKLFVEVGNQIEGELIPIESVDLYEAEGLGRKLLNHVVTVRTLCNGYSYSDFEFQIDFSSIAVLTRAAFETYLIFNYLFVSPKNADEKEFKFQSWLLGGLDRTKYKPALAANQIKWEQEKLQFEQISNKIKATSFFSTLRPNRQRDVLNGTGNWEVGLN